jgi:hypothetical protein
MSKSLGMVSWCDSGLDGSCYTVYKSFGHIALIIVSFATDESQLGVEF